MDKETLNKLKVQMFYTLETLKSSGQNITIDLLDKFIENQVSMLTNVTPQDKSYLRAYLESNLFVQHDHDGYAIVDDEDSDDREWYTNSDHEEEHFWKLYREQVIQEGGMDLTSLNKLGEVTLPRLMNCLGNPKDKLQNQRVRYGMVIGDVQSGKTGTYAGLICKAGDAGMKVVILLAGQTETLRQQTQERMEEDIVGYTIRHDENHKTQTDRVGVGKMKDYRPIIAAYTSFEDDFKIGRATTMSSIDAHSSMIMFVVKKNVPVLSRLYKWLTSDSQTKNENGKLPYSLLLIDDEADNASVNTKDPKYDPTATNAIIRQLCEAFMNSNYVGFTATPYANIFINPEKDETMETTDLFPKDFIYVLPTPKPYIGAMRIFGEPSSENPQYGDCKYMLKYITDIRDRSKEEIKNTNPDELNNGPIYYKHSNNWRGQLPESLDSALKCFYITNVIRDMDGYESAPRTMLINMSRFQSVQSYIKGEISQQVEADFNEIRCNLCGDPKKDQSIRIYQQLSVLFDVHYVNCKYKKEDVLSKERLLKGVEKIRVIVVNGTQEAKTDAPNYKENPSQRIIAVGGLALSRGLTLKGLTTSYFYRNTATYDTLMQMGRWFGYRPHYDYLCQVWITSTSANWYREIAESTEEMKRDLAKMNIQKLTPKEFGIRIRRDETALEITARNKRRKAESFSEIISYWGNIFETPYFSFVKESNDINLSQTTDFIKELISDGRIFDSLRRTSTLFTKDIPVSNIMKLLRNLNISMFNRKFNTDDLCNFIEMQNRDSDVLDTWDVAIIGGNGEEVKITDSLTIKAATRSISTLDNVFAFTNNGVIGGANDGKVGIENEQDVVDEYLKKEKEDDPKCTPKVGRRTWFKYVQRKPLLMLYFVTAKNATNAEPKLASYLEALNGQPIMGYAVGIPGCGHKAEEHEYYANIVYMNQDDFEDYSDEDEEL